MIDRIRFKNLLFEAAHAIDSGHESRALQLLDQARLALIKPALPPKVKPEDDPTRPAVDRAAWRAAKAG